MKFTDVGPNLKEIHVREFEDKVGYRLPAEYIMLLRTANGGTPERKCYPMFGMPKNPETSIEQFYGIGTGDEITDANHAYDRLRDRLVPYCIPIAFTPSGSQIILMLDGPLEGGVYYWDYYSRKRDMYQRIYPLATTINLLFETYNRKKK